LNESLLQRTPAATAPVIVAATSSEEEKDDNDDKQEGKHAVLHAHDRGFTNEAPSTLEVATTLVAVKLAAARCRH
jgi:hypothetical protein